MKFVTLEQFLELKEWAFKLGLQMADLDQIVCRHLEERNASHEPVSSGQGEEVGESVQRHLQQLSLACAAYPRDTVDLWAARWIGYNSTLALSYPVDLEQYRQDLDDLERLWDNGRSPDLRPKSNSEETEELLSKWLPRMDVAEIRNTTKEQEKNQQRLDQLLPPYSNWKFFSSRAVLGCDEGSTPVVSIPEDIALPAAFQRFYDSARHALDCIIEVLGVGGVSHLLTEYSRWVKPLIKREIDAFESLKGELMTNATIAELNYKIGETLIEGTLERPQPENHPDSEKENSENFSHEVSGENGIPTTTTADSRVAGISEAGADAKQLPQPRQKKKRGGSNFKKYSKPIAQIPLCDRSIAIGITKGAKLFFPNLKDNEAVADLLIACEAGTYQIHLRNRQSIIFNLNALPPKTDPSIIAKLRPKND